MIEGTTIITLMIILDPKIEIDHIITTNPITILDIIIDQEAKKKVDPEIEIEAKTKIIITETDLEADP